MNVFRRHLTASQISMVMARLREPFEREAKKRQEATLAKPGEQAHKRANAGVCPTLDSPKNETNTAQLLAKKAGVGRGTMADALTVDKHGTEEEKAEVTTGKKPVSKVAKEIRERKPAKSVAKPAKNMNKTNENIGWAQYSWNPVTGCEFGCPYCYAKEITTRHFKGDFSPKIHEDRLDMPSNTKPKASDDNNRVFVCSMGELFGDWVPQECVDQVLAVCENNPQWTFLFLAKNPSRLPLISFPANSWVGTAIDRQERVKAAVEAFKAMPMETKLFISLEPLTESITLPIVMWERLDLAIIGALSKGATKVQTKSEWVESLFMEARKSNTKVWFKDNLIFRPQESI